MMLCRKRPGGLKVHILESELLSFPFLSLYLSRFLVGAKELSGKEDVRYPSHAPHKMSGQHSWLAQGNG